MIQFILFNEDTCMIKVLKYIYLVIVQAFILINEIIGKLYAFKFVVFLAK